MPFVKNLLILRRAFGFSFLPGRWPASARHFIAVAVVPKFHDVIDPHAAIAIVVIVALPQRSERIDRHLVIVSKIPRESFQFASVGVTSEDHAHSIGFAVAVYFVSIEIDDGLFRDVSNRSMQRHILVYR